MGSNETIIRVEHVSKLYGPNRAEAARMMEQGAGKDEVYSKTGCTVALWDINLEIPKGNVFVIIGLSGSGKSTIVRCFNRLTVPTGGKVLFEGQDVNQLNQKELLELRRERVSMVFQSFGLMSHRDVMGNVAYGLEVKGIEREQREKEARKVISMVGLEGWENKSCDELSGGMRQRVGIARALVSGAEVLLMDEPFSALDPLVRRDMQFELLRIQRKMKKTIIFITHDMDEAFKMGDIVCIMRDGRIVQTGTPEQLSLHPADDYVRDFIEGANKAMVLSVRNIMITPSCIVRMGDTVDYAIREMHRNELSSVFVVDQDLHLSGMLTIQDAIGARSRGTVISDLLRHDVASVSADTLVSDAITVSKDTPYPLAVTDEENRLLGIVTKAGILSSIN